MRSKKSVELQPAGDTVVRTREDSLEGRKGEYFGALVERAMDRRSFLQGAGAVGATLVLTPSLGSRTAEAAGLFGSDDPSQFLTFETVPPARNTDLVVPEGYSYDVIIRWGDPLTSDTPEFDVDNQSAAAQSNSFGFNCDLVLWYPLPDWTKEQVEEKGELTNISDAYLGRSYPRLLRRPTRLGLMAINHEYTTGPQMFRSYTAIDPVAGPTDEQREQRLIEIQAHGLSVIEVQRTTGVRWEFVKDSVFNRRITGTTPIAISGPLAGDPLMQTPDDPTGKLVLGMFNNCAGGKTPWGTILTCEENFDQYFGFFNPNDPNARFSNRIPPEDGSTSRQWEEVNSRFNYTSNPKEYHRFGYIVEIDPYDPNFTPIKRTSLGRFKHEGASVATTADNRIAVYSGDDARFEYVYKYVSNGSYTEGDRRANSALLDDGVLYVARFDVGVAVGDDMGPGEWLPLVWEEGNVLDQAGYASQAEVLLDTRGAADVLGATPMDRPEDIEVSPVDGRVMVCLTNNSRREEPDEANPRAPNPHGHIVEIIEDGGDAASTTFSWNIFVRCGNPEVPEDDTRFGDVVDPIAAGVSPISDPDNIVFDENGNLWVATDGQFFSRSAGFTQNDGVFAVPVEGENRGLLRQFLSGIPGGEVCGPEFSGDQRTFFCAIQHPHDSDGGGGNAFDPKDFDGNPIPRWPVGETQLSKPSLVGVYSRRGDKIGL
jgi:secreted PhoX family phosphatase